jgi:hypothetical protein
MLVDVHYFIKGFNGREIVQPVMRDGKQVNEPVKIGPLVRDMLKFRYPDERGMPEKLDNDTQDIVASICRRIVIALDDPKSPPIEIDDTLIELIEKWTRKQFYDVEVSECIREQIRKTIADGAVRDALGVK